MKKFIILVGFLGWMSSAIGMVNDMLLTDAIEQGKSEYFIQALIERGADVDRELIDAAINGKLKIMQALIASGANINAKNKYDNTALTMAAKKGNLEIVQALIAAGADLDAKNATHGETALMEATKEGNLEIVQALIAAGADVNKQDEYGMTASTLAAADGLEIVQALITAGADVNKTLIAAAAKPGNLEIVQALIAAGADLNKSLYENSNSSKNVNRTGKLNKC